MSLWMVIGQKHAEAHPLEVRSLPNAALISKAIHISKGNDSLALNGVKSRDLKHPRVDANQRYTSGYKGKSSCTAEDIDPKSFSLQFGKSPIVDRKKFGVGESSTMRRKTELFNDEATISQKVSTEKLTECSIKWKNSESYSCHSPDVSRTEFEHFPMFDINRKIEAIMTSNKKYAYGAISAKMKEESFSLHEKVMMPYEGLLPDNTDDIGGGASKFFQINGKLFTTRRRSDADSNSENFGNPWTNVKEGSTHMLRQSSPSYHPYPFSSDRHDTEEKDDSSNKIFLCQKRLKSEGSDVDHWHCNIPQHSVHDTNLHEPCRIFKPVESEERFHMCFRKPTKGDYAVTQFKETAFSERRIIPFGQKYDKEEISTVPSRNFTSEEVRNYRDGTGAYLMGASNESSTRTARTDTINNRSLYRLSSPYGETFSSTQKGVSSSNSPLREAARRIPENVIAKRRVDHHPASADRPTHASHNNAGSSRTETMALDLNNSLAMITDNTSGSEMCSRWVKRLQDSHSETLSFCAKRLKEGDSSSTECYNPKLTVMPCSGYSEKSVQLWIRRWSQNCSENFPSVSRPPEPEPVAFQQESLKELPEKFRGKLLGSIGAMALMGKAMSAYRPCTFRRKRASLVWNA